MSGWLAGLPPDNPILDPAGGAFQLLYNTMSNEQQFAVLEGGVACAFIFKNKWLGQKIGLVKWLNCFIVIHKTLGSLW